METLISALGAILNKATTVWGLGFLQALGLHGFWAV